MVGVCEIRLGLASKSRSSSMACDIVAKVVWWITGTRKVPTLLQKNAKVSRTEQRHFYEEEPLHDSLHSAHYLPCDSDNEGEVDHGLYAISSRASCAYCFGRGLAITCKDVGGKTSVVLLRWLPKTGSTPYCKAVASPSCWVEDMTIGRPVAVPGFLLAIERPLPCESPRTVSSGDRLKRLGCD
jgi:hypothetical protein